MSVWGLDLGTTNSGLARWNAEARRADLVELPRICRRETPVSAEEWLGAPRMVPSCVHALAPTFSTKIGRWPVVRDLMFLGEEAEIGRPALAKNEAWPNPCYAPSFKSQLQRDPLRPVARLGDDALSAREVLRLFLRELFDEVKKTTGERVRHLVCAAPIAAHDRYRAEIRAAVEQLGVRDVRFLDEPVAAAVGYGLGLDRPREVLVVDMGGGTLHMAAIKLTPRGVEKGGCDVRAKEGRSVGGNVVDRWVLEATCEELGVLLPETPTDESEVLWQRMMLAEARRVKELVHTSPEATFTMTAPEELRGLRARIGGVRASVWTPARLLALLEKRGLFELLDTCLASVGGTPDEVLLVGGSTLLPGIYPRFEQRFGRDRVRAWQPFEAVALGAAAYGGGGVTQADYIIHDYALLTHNLQTGAPEYTVIVPRGTPFPSSPDLWRRQLVPTCALGEPERIFKLVIYEIGRNGEDGVRFGWDASGTLQPMTKDATASVIVPLNEGNPALGTLDPPHPPTDKRPRLDVSFGVDANRWLVATVRDLNTKKVLLASHAVARVL